MASLVNSFSIYANKKVFLTGHTGFKGSWLLKLLHLLGAEVKGYALAPSHKNDLYHLIDGDKLCDSMIYDLRNKEKLKKAIIEFEPDFIFHLAAQPLVRLSYQIPAETFEVNAIGTANVLDAVKELNGKCAVVLITTDKVYHNFESLTPYKEEDRLGGYDPYSASKACAELIIDSYRNSFFNVNVYEKHQKAIAVARAGNVIGGGDWSEDRLVPDIAKALAKNIEVVIRNPNAIRPWQHVLEPITAYLVLGAKLYQDPQAHSKAYNFGPNTSDELSVKEMVELTLNSWGTGTYCIHQNEAQYHEAGLLKLDISKAKTELDWSPSLTAQEAVKLTMSWYAKFATEPEEINKYTEEQILGFLNA